jgi:AcrR family transcriptional regulator
LDTEADCQEFTMARKPEPPTPGPDASNRDKLIEAFMALLAERRFEELGFGDLAARAGVSLAACRAEFGSMLAVLAAYAKEIDHKVLAGLDSDLADELPRERLFDVLMRRLEALAPHKGAIRSLMRSARRNPPLALALNGLTVQSMQWMLTAADINAAGPGGALRAQGVALLYASALRTWIDDDDPGLARTMAALDRELARGARWAGFLDTLCRFAPSRYGARRRPRPDRTDLDEEPIPA